MSVTVYTAYLCHVTVQQCKWPSGPFAFIKYILSNKHIPLG